MVEIDDKFKEDTITAYTDQGQVILDRNTMKPISHGKYGEVYDMGNGNALKRFFNAKHTSYSGTRGTAKVIKTIKNLQLQNLYVIKDILYSGKFKLNKEFIGYTMTKYEPIEIDFTQVDINYIINNYNSIKEDFLKLANNNIIVRDLHSDNVIITEDKIIIIDADNYSKEIFGAKSLGEGINLNELNVLFAKLLVESYYKYHRDDQNIVQKVNHLNAYFREIPKMLIELKEFNTFDEYLEHKLNITKSHSM